MIYITEEKKFNSFNLNNNTHKACSNIYDFLKNTKISFLKNSTKFRKEFNEYLSQKAYLTRYKINPFEQTQITAYKNSTGICLQIGNTARLHSDILKINYLYMLDEDFQAIIIVPTNPNGNRAYLKRTIQDINLYKNFIKVPIKVIAIDCSKEK